MRVIVAPDSFKGTLTAPQAAAAMAAGVRAAIPDAAVTELPVADGGEGTAAIMAAATGGRLIPVRVRGPLGDPVDAAFALLGDGATAVIEMAAASGLLLIPRQRRDPTQTSTYGTGELIRAALAHGCRRLVVAIGGSATNDGGAGMAQALGAELLTAAGQPIPTGGAGLLELGHIDTANLDARLAGVEVRVACDVDIPLCGPRGAAAVYGPQKGATAKMVALLERALAQFAAVTRRDLGRDIANEPGAGAAGGLGAGLIAFLGARLEPGIELVLETCGFDSAVAGADLVITGEGRSDLQTLAGKVPLGVARRAARHGVPAVVVSGTTGRGVADLESQSALPVFSASPCGMPPAEAMANAGPLLMAATRRVLQVFALGRISP